MSFSPYRDRGKIQSIKKRCQKPQTQLELENLKKILRAINKTAFSY